MTPTAQPAGRFRDVRWIASTGSTNADLVAEVQGTPRGAEPIALFTELQTAGRGRRDRTWEMPSGGGIMVSFFVPWTNPDSVHLVPISLGIAAVDAVADTERTVELKWPNDLLSTDGRKVAGMLSEVVHEPGGQLRGVVVGLGCNVSWPETGAAEPPNAASLNQLAETSIDRESLAGALVVAFDAELDRLSASGPTAVLDRYRGRCATLGSSVRIQLPDGSDQVGIATDIDASGRLLLDTDGHLRTLDVGDVVHLRPDANRA